jgi:hypothetical protein
MVLTAVVMAAMGAAVFAQGPGMTPAMRAKLNKNDTVQSAEITAAIAAATNALDVLLRGVIASSTNALRITITNTCAPIGSTHTTSIDGTNYVYTNGALMSP